MHVRLGVRSEKLFDTSSTQASLLEQVYTLDGVGNREPVAAEGVYPARTGGARVGSRGRLPHIQ